MRTIAALILLTIIGGGLSGDQAARPRQISANEKQEMLGDYLSVRVINGRPAVPALVLLCPMVTGIPLDSTYRKRLNSLMVRDEIVAEDCSAIGRDLDSLSRHSTRQVLAIMSFDASATEATIAIRVFRIGGFHQESAHFKKDLGWVLDSLVLNGFFEI